MANKLTDMSKIRKVIKFHCGGKSKLFISQYLSLSRNTVKKYISLFEVQGLSLKRSIIRLILSLKRCSLTKPMNPSAPGCKSFMTFSFTCNGNPGSSGYAFTLLRAAGDDLAISTSAVNFYISQ